jgi:hypothetical protein
VVELSQQVQSSIQSRPPKMEPSLSSSIQAIDWHVRVETHPKQRIRRSKSCVYFFGMNLGKYGVIELDLSHLSLEHVRRPVEHWGGRHRLGHRAWRKRFIHGRQYGAIPLHSWATHSSFSQRSPIGSSKVCWILVFVLQRSSGRRRLK